MVDALWCPSILPWVVSFISMHTASPVKVSRDVEDPGYHRLQRWIYSDLMRPENYYKFIFEQHGDFFEYVTGDSAWSQEVLLSFPRETMLGTFPRQDVLLAHSPYCVVFPDSQEDYKQWPPQRIAETVACIRRETGLRVLLCGHGKKRGLAEAILSQLPSRDGVLNLMGETTLVDIFDVIGQSAFVVCNDSFALHAANAMAVSPICITAGLYPGRYLPYPAPYQTAPHFYIYPPLTGQPGQHPLESITVRHVMPAVHAALAAAPKTGVTIGSDAAMVAFERERVRLSA
jgi:ADP-heptose:LPS heptosyltransferase